MSERDTTDLPEEEPTPAWLRAALDTAPPVDELTRERHVRAALDAFDDQRVRRAPSRGGRWLAAAAVVVALGVGGIWASTSDMGSDSGSDQVAGRESSLDSAASLNSNEAGDAAPSSSAADASGFDESPSALEEATRQSDDGADLGVFGTDAQLRLAIPSTSLDTTVEPALPETAPTDGAATRVPGCVVPPVPSGTSVTTYTATVAGVPVEVWVFGTSEGTSITVLDAATCTVRPA